MKIRVEHVGHEPVEIIATEAQTIGEVIDRAATALGINHFAGLRIRSLRLDTEFEPH
jgi:hypothetical protein